MSLVNCLDCQLQFWTRTIEKCNDAGIVKLGVEQNRAYVYEDEAGVSLGESLRLACHLCLYWILSEWHIPSSRLLFPAPEQCSPIFTTDSTAEGKKQLSSGLTDFDPMGVHINGGLPLKSTQLSSRGPKAIERCAFYLLPMGCDTIPYPEVVGPSVLSDGPSPS